MPDDFSVEDWSVAELVGATREICPLKEPDCPAVIVTPDGSRIRLDRIVSDGRTVFLITGDTDPATPQRVAAMRDGIAAYERLLVEVEGNQPQSGARVETW